MKKWVVGFLVMLMVFGVFGVSAMAGGNLKVVITTWAGYGPLFIAKDKGFFKKYGVDMNIITMQDIGARKQALAGKKVDGMATALDVGVTLVSQGVPINMVWILDTSNGADGIVATKDIKTIEGLKGKKVALMINSTSHLFFLTVLKDHHMTAKDVTVVPMTAGDAGAAFVAGRVDAAVTWEPWLSKGVKSGRGHILVSSKSYPGLIADVLLFRKDVAEANPKLMVGVVKGLKDAMAYYPSHKEECVKIISKGLREDVKDLKNDLKGIRLYNYQDNLKLFGGKIYKIAEQAAEIYYQLGVIKNKPNPSEFLVAQFLKEAEK